MLNKADSPVNRKEPVVIKKYANRRLYNTETSTYVTLDDLAQMVRSERDFVVYDAKSGDDLTHSVLTQIIVEQESRSNQTMLPIPFLRQLIRFYGGNFERLVPSFLQVSMDTLIREQERFRAQFPNPFSTTAFEAYQEQARKNLALFEQAFTMFNPFNNVPGAAGRRAGEEGAAGADAPPSAEGAPATPASASEASPPAASPPGTASSEAGQRQSELDLLRAQMLAMQEKLDKLSRG
jgi:polyhydroxyalkanoate synthesis repressor PhaR